MPRLAVQPLPFSGFGSPNFTQVPDELFDVLMPQLSDAELRVLLYIVRRTFGFKRDADAISLSQMVSGITTKDGKVLDSGTGLAKSTVARGLAGLRAKGVIVAERNASAQRGDEPTTYRLKFKAATSEEKQAKAPVSQQRDTQKTVKQDTDFEYSIEDALGNTKAGDGIAPHQTDLPSAQKRSVPGMEPLGAVVRRLRPQAGGAAGEDRLAITAAIERLAAELGDSASKKATLTRTLNLFALSETGRDAFIDLLFQASAEVKDRRRNPGKAPLPRNRMAYFFAVVEDRLGLAHEVVSGS